MKACKSVGWRGLFVLVAFAAHGAAQLPKGEPTAAAVPAQQSGPSMDDTIDFLKQTYERRPNVVSRSAVTNSEEIEQDVLIENPESCRLQITTDNLFRDAGFMHLKRRFVLALGESDPLSISVLQKHTGSDIPAPYFVTIKRAIGAGYFLPLPVQENRPVLDRTKLKPGFLDGFVLSIGPAEFTIIAQDENRWRFTLPVPHAVITRDRAPAAISDVQVGDELTYEPNDTENKLEFASSARREIGKQYFAASLPPLPDEETANRVAKALIHAMALCHKNEKPSPF